MLSVLTLQYQIFSEFPYIWGKICFLFISTDSIKLFKTKQFIQMGSRAMLYMRKGFLNPHIWGNAQIFNHIWGGRQSYMTLHPIPSEQRLNMVLDLQSLFGLLWTSVLIGWDLATPPLNPHLSLYTRALLVSQDRKHLFVTPCFWISLYKRIIFCSFLSMTSP